MYAKPRTVCVERIAPMMGVMLLLLAFLIFYSSSSLAAGYQYQFGGGQEYYSGLKDQSLAPNTATNVRFGARFADRSIMNWIASTTLISSSGSSSFKVSGTSTTMGYQLLGGEFLLGFRVTPLANSNHLPIQPFFGAGGVVQLNSVKFPDAPSTSTTFPKSDAQYFAGYTVLVGVDVYMNKNFGFGLQVEQISAGGTLASESFSTGSNRFLLVLFIE